MTSTRVMHPEIEPRSRAILIDWLGEVCQEFRVTDSNAFFLTVSYLDQFLSLTSKPLPLAKLQLLGVCCFSIAL